MALHTDIKAQMVEAMKARESLKLEVLRGLLSAFTNEVKSKDRKPEKPARTTDSVQSGEVFSDEEVLAVISRAVKQRKDSIEQFEKGGRADLADAEKAELAILNTYLPEQMSREEVEKFVRAKFESEKPDKDNMNRFMGLVMKELKGKVDGGMVKEAIDSLLN